ncbi:hypothetical protein LMG23992_00241 [Cupriavidus laharis]|uniref:Uncharacterized protein n=1 Tax=Cupriavidus laharis TaxID=151654 RepID=A0ABN7XVI8_9BURK|nr:hypothetical protein [Cupriavidus laharis]CAG9165094.1 hypothetical protein LMG23992_00241 [Cupriavidus laharis]
MSYLSDWLQQLQIDGAEDAERVARERAAEAEKQRRQQRRRDARTAQALRGAARKARTTLRRVEAERYRADTLASQFQRWWAVQPVATRMRPHTFSEIKAQLHGVTAGKTAGNTALVAVLRAAGWRKARVWIDSPDKSRRQWLPPGVVTESDDKPSKGPTPVKRPRGRPRKFDHASLPHADDYL